MPTNPNVTHALAERHEALWIGLAALHRDVLALGAKRPGAAVSDAVRSRAEGLLSDCLPFLAQNRIRLPVAAPDMAGLAVQLGQGLAALEAWESQRSFVDPVLGCRMWRVTGARLPIMRLKPPAAALAKPRQDVEELREKLIKRIHGQRAQDFQNGFRAGQAARQGKPLAEIAQQYQQTYPRLRLLD